MNLESFLTRVLPDEGTYYAGAQIPNSTRYTQTSAATIQDLSGQIENTTVKHRNAYYLSGTTKDGSNRTAANVWYKKTFYLDLDCGEGKDFPDQDTAIREMVEFARATSLPAPTIILSSGYGVHIYWVLTESIKAAVWKPIATALKEKCIAHSFPADPSVTDDLARILRPPETVNYKDAKHPKVTETRYVDKHDVELEKITAPLGLNTVPDELDYDFGDNSDLSDGVGFQDIPHFARYVVDLCPVMQEAMQTGGKDFPEMLWSQQLNLLAFCEDGQDFIHKISKGHAGYTAGATNRKFQTKLQAKTRQATGPTKCVTFEGFKPDLCAGCPSKNAITTPLQLGLPAAASEYPKNWTHKNGWTWQLVEGELAPRFRVVFEEVKLYAGDEGYIISMTHKVNGKVHTAEVPMNMLQHDPKTAARIMSTAYMEFTPKQLPYVGGLMMAWIDQIKRGGKVKQSVQSYGWLTHGNHGFAAGNKIFWPDGTQEVAAVGDVIIRKQYQPNGDLAPWKAAAAGLISSGSVELQIGLASAFGAPLVRFSQVKGVMISLMSSESATGKSTCLQVAQAVWGDPHSGINALDDTTNSLSKKLGMLNNLPAYWDEVRGRDGAERFIKLVFQVGQGKDKSRLTANSTMMQTGTWQTMLVVATNEPIADHMEHLISGTNAGSVRIMEIDVPPIKNHMNSTLSSDAFDPLYDNYGLAGEVYSKYLAEHEKKVKDMVNKITDDINKEIKAAPAERFWVATISSLLVGAAIAQSLGLVQFDVVAMKKRLLSQITDSREYVEESSGNTKLSASEIIMQFMQENSRKTHIATDVDGRVCAGSVITPADQGCIARVGLTYNTLSVARSPFKRWLYSKGYHPSTIIKIMKRDLGMEEKRIRLTARDEHNVLSFPQERVYRISLVDIGDATL